MQTSSVDLNGTSRGALSGLSIQTSQPYILPWIASTSVVNPVHGMMILNQGTSPSGGSNHICYYDATTTPPVWHVVTNTS